MSRRSEARQQMRQRIVEATLKLHGENGIYGTSWQEIAHAAGVSVATVYKHFPSLDELVPACGDVLMRRTQPPTPESAAEIIGDAMTLEARLERVAGALFAFYERGGSHLESDLRERRLPAVSEWEAYLRATVTSLIESALDGRSVTDDALDIASALLDRQTFRAMRDRGLSPQRAASTVAQMAARQLAATRIPTELKEDSVHLDDTPALTSELIAVADRPDAPAHERLMWMGEPTTIMASGAETGGQYTLIEIVGTPEGFVPRHVHHREDEAFYLLEGEVTFQVGDTVIEGRPGTFVFGPRDVPHGYTIISPSARMLMLFSPAGFEGFIRATSEPADAATSLEAVSVELDFDQVLAAATRFGAEILD